MLNRARYWMNRFLLHTPIGEKPRKYSLACLNLAQFFGVINDNMFKLVLVYLLIEVQGQAKASLILSAAGAIFVVPFLLFSSAAGVLADKYSKQRLLVLMKIAEILIMALAIVAFTFKSVWGGYTLLFLLSTHSALFGPSKYGIIPELVSSNKVSRANGLITSSTYLAIILGTFLASFLTDATHRNFPLIAGFCLCMAVLGLISACLIQRTYPQGSQKKINPLFVREIFQTLFFCRTKKHLLPAIFGSAYFLLIGAFAQLNIIPFAIQALGLSEIAGGYLFLAVALGIAVGSMIAGKTSKKQIELGLSCLAGFFVALFLILIGTVPATLVVTCFFLFLLGVAGGTFIVPFDTFLQVFSPSERRGQVIGASNFLGFTGVLIASGFLYLFSDVLDVSSATGFSFVGALTVIVSLIFTFVLADFSLPFIARRLIAPFFKINALGTELVEKTSLPILVLQEASWLKALLLLKVCPNLRFALRKGLLSRLFHTVQKIDDSSSPPTIAKKMDEQGSILCLFAEAKDNPSRYAPKPTFKDLFLSTPHYIFVSIEKLPTGHYEILFTKEPRI
jgi:acyl-[acyl-carrier-protein]-phospholipid O-acyltransferase/long-chain-fatty-acid--[acyl-carrier-protein] ligase